MKRILVVDDNQIDRLLTKHIINQNFSVILHAVSDGYDALESIKRHKYDLVITDIVMPRMEGIELIRKIKKTDPDLDIIAISGSKPFYLYMAKKLGSQGVFTKPIDQQKLISLISKLLSLPVSQTITS